MKTKFKYRKIMKYLKSKDEKEYNNLDHIFQVYITEQLQKELMSYNFSKIECFSQIWKKGNYLQINFWYFNLVITIQFNDLFFEYCVYLPGMTVNQVDESFIQSNYSNNFGIEQFFDEFHLKLENDDRLLKNN